MKEICMFRTGEHLIKKIIFPLLQVEEIMYFLDGNSIQVCLSFKKRTRWFLLAEFFGKKKLIHFIIHLASFNCHENQLKQIIQVRFVAQFSVCTFLKLRKKKLAFDSSYQTPIFISFIYNLY
ncbi:hypothetical protein FKM82_009871 [Ascaphus truei]